jgi:hypothetical protein
MKLAMQTAVMAFDKFASYDGLTAGTNPEATKELDQAFWRARDSVSAWPQHDQFLSMGIEPK